MSHQLLYDLALSRGMGCRTKPGEFFARLRPEIRERLVATVNSSVQPAPWVIALLCGR